MNVATPRTGRLIGLGLSLVAVVHAEPRWYKTETPHFEVYSSANKAETREIIADLELFHQSAVKTFSIKPQVERRTKIVIFGRERDLDPYKPDLTEVPDDSMAYDVTRRNFVPVMNDTVETPTPFRVRSMAEMNLDRLNGMRNQLLAESGRRNQVMPDVPKQQHAFSVSHPDETLIVLSGEADWEVTKSTLFGRHTVTLLQDCGIKGPRWFLEGMAAMMSTFDIQRGTFALGRGSIQTLGFLHQVGYMMPWDEFFATGAESDAYRSLGHRDLFNGQAWLLLHYCYFSEERSAEWRAALLAWIADVQRGEGDMIELLHRHLGVTPEELTMELLAYRDRSKFPALVRDRPATWPGKRVTLTRMAKEERDDILLDVRVRITRDDEAILHLRERADRPDAADARAEQLLGVDAMMRDDVDAHLAHWSRAKDQGIQEPAIVRHAAEVGLDAWVAELDPGRLIDDVQAAAWRTDLEEALRLDPDNELTLQWLGWLEALAETPSIENMNRVQQAVSTGMAQPDFALMAVAIMRARVGDMETAREIAERYRDWRRWEWREMVERVSETLRAESSLTASGATEG